MVILTLPIKVRGVLFDGRIQLKHSQRSSIVSYYSALLKCITQTSYSFEHQISTESDREFLEIWVFTCATDNPHQTCSVFFCRSIRFDSEVGAGVEQTHHILASSYMTEALAGSAGLFLHQRSSDFASSV